MSAPPLSLIYGINYARILKETEFSQCYGSSRGANFEGRVKRLKFHKPVSYLGIGYRFFFSLWAC